VERSARATCARVLRDSERRRRSSRNQCCFQKDHDGSAYVAGSCSPTFDSPKTVSLICITDTFKKRPRRFKVISRSSPSESARGSTRSASTLGSICQEISAATDLSQSPLPRATELSTAVPKLLRSSEVVWIPARSRTMPQDRPNPMPLPLIPAVSNLLISFPDRIRGLCGATANW
jgi:hypothetical protein